MFNIMDGVVNAIDRALGGLRAVLSPQLFSRLESFFIGLAGIATPLAAVLGLLIGFVVAIKLDSLVLFLSGGAWVLAVLVLYYTGAKMLKSCAGTIERNPSDIGSQDFLDVMAFLNLISALTAFIAGAYVAIKASELQWLWYGLGLAVVLLYVVWVLLHPSLIGTYVRAATSAGFDAIAILVMANKIYLRAAPIFFGLGTVMGAVLLLFSLVKSFGNGVELLASGLSGLAGFIAVIAGLLAPLVLYLLFVLGYLLLDVLRSILSVRGLPASDAMALAQPLVPRTEPPVQPAMVASQQGGSATLNPRLLRQVGIAVAAMAAVVFLAIQGKAFYQDYKQKAELRRQEEARIQAEEEQRKAAEAAEQERRRAEQARIDALVSAARKHLNANAQDMLLEPEVNKAFRGLFTGDRMSAFESYYTQPDGVTEANGYITGSGCRAGDCDNYRSMYAIDTKTGQVMAVVVNLGAEVKYFGVNEPDAPPAMRKWVLNQPRKAPAQ